MKPTVGQRLLIIVAVSLAAAFTLTKMLESVVTMMCNTSEIQLRLQEIQIKTAEFGLKVQASEAQSAKDALDKALRERAMQGVQATVKQLELQNQLLKHQIQVMEGQLHEPTPACPFEFSPPTVPPEPKRDRSAGSQGKHTDVYPRDAARQNSSDSTNSSAWTQLGYQRNSEA
jgi:hypothetical protein